MQNSETHINLVDVTLSLSIFPFSRSPAASVSIWVGGGGGEGFWALHILMKMVLLLLLGYPSCRVVVDRSRFLVLLASHFRVLRPSSALMVGRFTLNEGQSMANW